MSQELLLTYQTRVERALDHWLPHDTVIPERLHEAMRYSTLDGGKRIRPALTYAAGSALGVPLAQLDGPACAIELIHVYSLIHDDLPAMDNDDLRRGKPTCHKAFDEATAILAGDALQSLAFHILSHDPEMKDSAEQRLQMLEVLALSSGSRGMAGGQAIDLESVGKKLNLAELENMHIHKTGALIRASVKLGALSSADLDTTTLDKLDHFAMHMGLAFQIRDDILDIESDTETLGKTQGADIKRNKPTYPALLGLKEAKAMAQSHFENAMDNLDSLGENAEMLRWLARFIVNRMS